jgi:cytidine deaminase
MTSVSKSSSAGITMPPSPTPAADSSPHALLEAARAAQANAYAPYSRFRVGAAIRTPSGRIFSGCNVENAAYPQGACAETGAIAAMVASGERRIAEILVVGDGDLLCTPCGGCRQRIREFAAGNARVHVAGADGVRASFTVDELLPSSFGPDNLTA